MDQYAENQTPDCFVQNRGGYRGEYLECEKWCQIRQKQKLVPQFMFLIRANQREVYDIRSNQCMPRGGKVGASFF